MESNWPVLDSYCMLLTNNNRSKCYLQTLCGNGFLPQKVIVLDNSNTALPEHTENDLTIHAQTQQKLIRKCIETNTEFDEKEHILKTLNKYKILHEILPILDINSSQVVQSIRDCPCKYVIYSGPGGTILRKEILSQGKYFLHAHPGWLPRFRGSTTIYYSILSELKAACSLILLTNEIDAGPILYRKEFKISTDVDLDYVLDPSARASTILDFFKNNYQKEVASLNIAPQEYETENTFYIIHPVLKHLARFRRDKMIKGSV